MFLVSNGKSVNVLLDSNFNDCDYKSEKDDMLKNKILIIGSQLVTACFFHGLHVLLRVLIRS